MCFVLIGCWPCGHMKPIRTRFCDQAEPLAAVDPQQRQQQQQPQPQQQQQQQPHPRPHAFHQIRPRGSSLFDSSSGGPAASQGLASPGGTAGAAAPLAPCPKGVNQYEHEPGKACPLCGKEPREVGAGEEGEGTAVAPWLVQELAEQVWREGGGTAGVEGLGGGLGADGQQLLAPPADGMVGGVDVRLDVGGEAEAELFRWCLGDFSTSSCGV
ncbi:hypothetical protein GTA08_BOTSDO05643 [Neofusicoccum parvum]|uniref:Uncharacterized protein n=1 Tax=Neofusicoccum parvum TaxID=310453 RepID=A0ACB5RSM1_9PEZI|nr:hypothetical protein GTA08_BOTSDO05643 [Neofusicoccum parvum]